MSNIEKMFSSSSSSRSMSSKSSTNSCRSSSNGKNQNGSLKEFNLNDIDEEWPTDTTPIISIELLTRGLGGVALGAVHTALLFETNGEYLVVEYGDTGLEARYYPKNKAKQIEAYQYIMGKSNEVRVFDLNKSFEHRLKLNNIYKEIDKIKKDYTIDNYSFLFNNCRYFVIDLCEKINCNAEGITFLSSFLLNVPHAIKMPVQGLLVEQLSFWSSNYPSGRAIILTFLLNLLRTKSKS